jgi:pyridoxal 5'-phosphate synthase pdxT subunit
MTTESQTKPVIGVLALQGAFIEHIKVLQKLGVATREVRLPADLEGIDGLIIPGGESTTIGKLMVNWNLLEPIKALIVARKPVWGTCAGMILLAQDIGGLHQPLIGAMDIKVRRNAFGSQLDSFEADLTMDAPGFDQPFHAVFIRAPYIEKVGERAIELARLEGEQAAKANPSRNGTGQNIVVAARQDNLLATAFHPELTDDPRFHQYFLSMVEEGR